MTERQENTPVEPPQNPDPITPRPIVFLFAAGFVVAMAFNMANDGSDMVTIFLGSAALLILGVDVGKLTGRR